MSSRLRVYRSEALVLRRHDFGEADRLLTVYTPDHGKLRLIAKGARRPASRKAGHLEPLTRVRLQIARGRNLDIITQAEAIEAYAALRQDLDLFSRAAYVIELVDRFAVEEPNRQLYRLLVNTLERLASAEPPAIALRFFELQLLEFAGYRPELFNCLNCSAEVKPEDQYFSAERGGAICANCGVVDRHTQRMHLPALKVLRHYQRNTYQVAAATCVRPEVHHEIEELMEDYLSYLLERKLFTPGFMRRVRSMRGRDGEQDN